MLAKCRIVFTRHIRVTNLEYSMYRAGRMLNDGGSSNLMERREYQHAVFDSKDT